MGRVPFGMAEATQCILERATEQHEVFQQHVGSHLVFGGAFVESTGQKVPR